MPAVAAVAVGSIAAGVIGANAAKDAAETQAGAMRDSARTSIEAGNRARLDILNRMSPALADYAASIQNAQDTIKGGTADVMAILQQSTTNADQLLQSVGIDARRAMMGSAAQSQGIPIQQFETQMSQALGQAPPAAGLPQVAGATSPAPGAAPAAGLATTAMPGATPAGGSGQLPIDMTMKRGGQWIPATGTGAAPGTGYAGAQQALTQGEQSALAGLLMGGATARGDIARGAEQSLESIAGARRAALEGFAPYTDAGQAAMEREAALSGAMGPVAQQAAIDAFIESPGQKYLREQQEKALLRSSAAIGGLGGGRIRSALMEQAMGIAATQQQQQLENLRSIAGRGQQAAGSVAGIETGMGQAAAGIQTGAAQNLANLANAMGVNVSQLMGASAQERAALAERAGLNLAQLDQAIGMARVAGVQGLGQGLAGAAGAQAGDIAQLQAQGGTTQLQAQQNLSSQLANLATGGASQAAQYQAQAGSALGTGQYLAGQQVAGTINTLGGLGGYALAKRG